MHKTTKPLACTRGTGILPVFHGRNAHATRGFARAPTAITLFSAALLAAMLAYGDAGNTNAPSAAEMGTIPPAVYVLDYYAPPPDWVPARPISDYSLNTRVPDLCWLKYEGAYTLALRIRPISKEQIAKDIEVGLIHQKRAEQAAQFSPEAEKRNDNRQVGVWKLDIPGDDFIGFSFKMKARTGQQNPAVTVEAMGIGRIDTTRDEDAETACKDGFKAYKISFPARKGARLTGIRIQLPAAEAYDPEEEYLFFDLNLKRAAPRPRFTDLPQRQWIRQGAFEADRPVTTQDGIRDIVAFVNSKPEGVTSLDLPLKGYELREQTEKDSDGGFKVENIKETINGQTFDAMRITLEQGPRCYLKFPVGFDARKYNTMTFYSRIELPGGLNPRKLYGDTYPNLYGTDAGTLNSFFDTFSFGITSATKDHMDWNRVGVSQGLTAWHRQRDAEVPDGWQAVALDFLHSDMAGNKHTYLPEITHWCFYYNNKKIPEGARVVITIAAPRVSTGLMYAGGELDKYKNFLATKDKFLHKDFPDSSRYLEPPATNRLPAPLPLIRNHVPQGEIILPTRRSYAKAYEIIVNRALDYCQSFLQNKYGMTDRIPVLAKPSDKDNTKIFLGSEHFAAVDKEQCAADLKILDGKAGCAIRARGSNIYIYGGNFNYAREARGIANGIYTLLENNTDEIMVFLAAGRSPTPRNVFEFSKDGNLDLVWGDGYVNSPSLEYWSVTGPYTYMDRNFNFPDAWHLGTWEYGGLRHHTVNHWWGYGTEPNHPGAEPNETWGLGEDGKRMLPGCYTGHPCLINVLDKAKAAYLGKAFRTREDNPQVPKGQSHIYRQQDLFGLWVEDTHKVCVCEKCLAPIRLANGSLVTSDQPEFRSTQFFANACAMINAVNVHARRDMQIESIGYLWMSCIPLFEISRNYKIRFCPYIRKNYFAPIYAPCNDLFWRDYHRWSQLDVTMGIYEYFLGVGTRPWSDIYQYDLKEEMALGLKTATPESDRSALAQMENWTLARLFWNPDSDPKELRRYYLRRTFREAAPAMEKFYFTLHNFIYTHFAYNQPTEFEDEQQVGTLAFVTPSEKAGGRNPDLTVADELIGYMEEARQKVRNPMSAQMLDRLYADWTTYIEKARKNSEILKREIGRRKP